MKPKLRRYIRKNDPWWPTIDCENCGRRIKDGSRNSYDSIIEDKFEPDAGCVVREYSGEPSLTRTYGYRCAFCEADHMSLVVTIASDYLLGDFNFSELIFKEEQHKLYTVKCGHLNWYIDRFTNVPFESIDARNPTLSKMRWVDFHRVGSILAPQWENTKDNMVLKLFQLYLPFMEQVRKGKNYG